MDDWKKQIHERYKALKEQGKSFFPHAVFKDVVVAVFILAALLFLAAHFGADLEAPADPTDTTYNPRPEWYFLFLFQALKFFPGKLEPVAAVLLPGLAVSILFFLPFIDRNRRRHPFNRPIATSLAVIALGGMTYLTIAGAKSPLVNAKVEKDPLVVAGKTLYESLRCNYCHSIEGKGGVIGPDLSGTAARRSEEWLANHLTNPKSVSKGTVMPQFNLMDDELKSLLAYLKSLNSGGGPYSDQAKVLFSDNCAVCHKIGNEGQDIGPDLSLLGTYRDKNFIYKYIEDPTQLNHDATMAGFKDSLKPEQIEDLARFLAAQRGKK